MVVKQWSGYGEMSIMFSFKPCTVNKKQTWIGKIEKVQRVKVKLILKSTCTCTNSFLLGFFIKLSFIINLIIKKANVFTRPEGAQIS